MRLVFITILSLLIFGASWIIGKELKLLWMDDVVFLTIGLVGILNRKATAQINIETTEIFFRPKASSIWMNRKLKEWVITIIGIIFIAVGGSGLYHRLFSL
jgi:hypothetical protein